MADTAYYDFDKFTKDIESMDAESIIKLYAEYSNKTATMLNNGDVDGACEIANEYDYLGHLIAEYVARGAGYKLIEFNDGYSIPTN